MLSLHILAPIPRYRPSLLEAPAGTAKAFQMHMKIRFGLRHDAPSYLRYASTTFVQAATTSSTS